MPEITSIQNIQAKLREFEKRIDGAIVAANTLARIRTDAENFVTHIEGIGSKSEQANEKISLSLKNAEDVRFQLNKMQDEWETLKLQLEKTQDKSKNIEKSLLSEINSAIQLLSGKFTDAEERLKTVNKISLSEQTELLLKIAVSTKADAESVKKSQSFVADTGARIGGLLRTLRDDLHAEIQDGLIASENILKAKAQQIEESFEEKQQTLHTAIDSRSENYQRLLREEMKGFKAEIHRDLAQQEQSINNRLTEFISKQNVMILNLSQQIDSFNRASQAQLTTIQTNDAKIREVSIALDTQQDIENKNTIAWQSNIETLQALIIKIQSQIEHQDKSIIELTKITHQNSVRLDETLNKLQGIPLLGGKFRNQ